LQSTVVRYLSDEWLAAVANEIALDASLTAAATHDVSVTQVVTDTPFGTVEYHLICKQGGVSFGKGAVPSDITFTQHYTTAVDIACGRLNAAEAFIHGKVKFSGNHERIVAAQSFFAALDAVFTRVRERTVYD
jgi:putative sterol carrier protein